MTTKIIKIHKDKPCWIGLYDCPKCSNNTISQQDNYCGKCGRKIKWIQKRD